MSKSSQSQNATDVEIHIDTKPDFEIPKEEEMMEIRFPFGVENPENKLFEKSDVVVERIFQFCEIPEILSLVGVNKTFRKMGTSNKFWEPVTKNLELYIPRNFPIRPSFLKIDQSTEKETDYFNIIRLRLKEGYDIRTKLMLDRFCEDSEVKKKEDMSLGSKLLYLFFISSLVWACPMLHFFGLILQGIFGTLAFKKRLSTSSSSPGFLIISPIIDTFVTPLFACCGIQICFFCSNVFLSALFSGCFCFGCCGLWPCLLPCFLPYLCLVEGVFGLLIGYVFSVVYSIIWLSGILFVSREKSYFQVMTSFTFWCLLITLLPISVSLLLFVAVGYQICDGFECEREDDEFSVFVRN